MSHVEIDCLTNSAWLIYEESDGAEDYVAIVTDTWGEVQTLECNSTSNGVCSLPEQECSQNLTFTLEARNKQCFSAPSNAVITETGKWNIELNYTRSKDSRFVQDERDTQEPKCT